MLKINFDRSGVVEDVGINKLKVVIDGDNLDEVSGSQPRDLARKTAAQQGFGSGGMCANPIIGPVGVDGEMLDGMQALKPDVQVAGFRAEFLFANRI